MITRVVLTEPPLCCSCNFDYEDSSGETATKDFEGKVVPGDCYLLSADLEQAFLIPGTNNPFTPWDFGFPADEEN